MTIEKMNNGRYRLNVMSGGGWVRHDFPNLEMLEKYADKCYADRRKDGEDVGHAPDNP